MSFENIITVLIALVAAYIIFKVFKRIFTAIISFVIVAGIAYFIFNFLAGTN